MFDLVIREETLANEKRTMLTPENVAELTAKGYKIALAEWKDRVYSEQEYKDAVQKSGNPDNFEIIPNASWKTDKRCDDSIILGIKEIVSHAYWEREFPLDHTYIHFDHSYKGQKGSWQRLQRFGFAQEGKNNSLLDYKESSTILLDHEYVVDEKGKRTHAFGESAGYATTAISILMWAKKMNGKELKLDKYAYTSKQEFLELEAAEIEQEIKRKGVIPKIVVLGGETGRSSLGARRFIDDLNEKLPEGHKLEYVLWDRKQTDRRQGSNGLEGIENFDIVLNCVFTGQPSPPFIDDKKLAEAKDKLIIFGDVTCDTTPDKNRLRFSKYKSKDFDDPTVEVGKNAYAITIDHSPTFFPKEASNDVAQQFMPHIEELLELKKTGKPIPRDSVWGRCLKTFEDKMEILAIAYRVGQGFKGISPDEIESKHKDIACEIVKSLSVIRDITPEEQKCFLKYVAMGVVDIHDYNKSDISAAKMLEGDELLQGITQALESYSRLNLGYLKNDPQIKRTRLISKVANDIYQDEEFITLFGDMEKAAGQKEKLPESLKLVSDLVTWSISKIVSSKSDWNNEKEQEGDKLLGSIKFELMQKGASDTLSRKIHNIERLSAQKQLA